MTPDEIRKILDDIDQRIEELENDSAVLGPSDQRAHEMADLNLDRNYYEHLLTLALRYGKA